MQDMKITNLNDFYKILDFIITKIKSNELQQFNNIEDIFCTDIDIRKFSKNSCLPDVIHCYFVDFKGDSKYLLDVETYHGIGGSFKQIK